MSVLKVDNLNPHSNGDPSQAIHTSLYELVEVVILSTRPDEAHLTGFLAMQILEAGNVQLSKRLVESIVK